MEDQFQQLQTQPPLPVGSEASSADADEAYLNSICGGLSFRTLLTYGSFDPAAAENPMPLKMTKMERPLFPIDDRLSAGYPQYTFFSDMMMPSSLPHQLPSLISYEQPQNTAAAAPVQPPITNPRAETASYRKQRYRLKQKHQKQSLSDKTRCLQKLLPREHKMDMATVLEEAYKYIKFLQAQVSVLQSMPHESAMNGVAPTSIGCGGDLGRLNRQQLLQVVVNSPVAQTQLYSKGCCIYSMEQLILLKKNAERKALYHQMMLDSISVNPKSLHS
ncbi:hypothetical protein OROHE_019535 [Orobanche hederae]